MTETAAFVQSWSFSQKLMFRFAFIYFALFIFFFPNAGAPVLNWFHNVYIPPAHTFIAWTETHIFHFSKPIAYARTGSGDTTYDWLMLLFVTIASVIGTLIWSVISRGPVSYDRLYYWLIVVLRYYVGLTMISYGAVKVVKLQFPMPDPGRLTQTYGDSSPFALAWTFMGFSKGYNYFTGFAEVICGSLLLFKRTTLIGAVIALTVSANIVAINFCFDVPVKIVASGLVVMVVVILLKDLDRIIKFFFLNQTAEPANLTPRRFKKPWKNITLLVVKYSLIAYVLIFNCIRVVQASKYFGDDVKHPVLYGLFNTQTFVLNSDTLAPLTTDTTRWRRILISAHGSIRVDLMNDSSKNYSYKNDTLKKTITMGDMKDTTRKYVFNYQLSKDSVLKIDGSGPHGPVSAVLKRFNEKSFTLMKRGFHFINENAFGR